MQCESYLQLTRLLGCLVDCSVKQGHPASGKSSLARQLARQTGFALSDKDDSRNCFHALEQAGQQGFPDLNSLSYAVMMRVAGATVLGGRWQPLAHPSLP